MKLDRTMIAMLAGGSLFIGFVLISVAVGAIFPSIHKLTAPLICNGDVEIETLQYSYKPGQMGWEHHIYCTGESGDRREITFPAIGVTGLIASAILFVIALIWMRKGLTLPANFGTLAKDLNRKKNSSGAKDGSALERMSELKKMYDQNLISQVEYERKKAEIMKEL
jgi:hypothetical protein